MINSLLKRVNRKGVFVKFAKKIAGKFIFSKKIINNKTKYKIHIINNFGYGNIVQNESNWVPDIICKLSEIKKSTFIDIGANIGQTLLQLRSVFDELPYIAFEPNPACIFYMKYLIEKNRIKNTILVPAGLFVENSLMSLFMESEVDSGATIKKEIRPDYIYENMKIVPMFDFATVVKNMKIKEIGIIKIDVEGVEYEVLKCLKPFLKEFKPLIVCEVLWAHNNDCLQSNESRNRNIEFLLEEENYNIYQIIKNDNQNNIKELLLINKFENKIYSLSNSNLCDYLFIHRDNIEQLKISFNHI